MAIKSKLRVVLAEREITQGQLHEMSGARLQSLSDLCTGKAKAIRFSTLNQLCKHLECQPGDLLKYIPDDEGP